MNKFPLAIYYLISGLAALSYALLFDVNFLQYLIIIFLVVLAPWLMLKPDWGLLALLLIRNIIDVFDKQNVLTVGSVELNLASSLGLLLIPWALIILTRKLPEQKAAGQPKLLKIPLVKIWLIFLFASTVSAALGQNPLTDKLEMVIKISNYFFLYLIGYLLSREISVKKYLVWMFVVLVIPVLVAISQLILTGISGIGLENRLNGTFAHPNPFAFALIIALAAILIILTITKTSQEKVFWIFSCLAYFTLLLLTFTRSAWIAVGIIAIFWIIFNQRRLLLPAAAVTLLLMIALPALAKTLKYSYNFDVYKNPVISRLQWESSDSEIGSWQWRLRTWRETLPAVWLRPWLGYGPGSFPDVRRGYVSYETDLVGVEAHNDYLRLAVELGLIGLAIYLLLYAAVLKNLLALKTVINKKIIIGTSALVIAIMIVSFSDNLLRNAPVQWMFWSLLGVILANLRIQANKMQDTKKFQSSNSQFKKLGI